MRITHLSTSDSSGGAARAAYRLHSGLRRMGVESKMLVQEKKSFDPDVKRIHWPMDWPTRLRRTWRRRRIEADAARYKNRPRGLEMFSDDRTEHAEQIAKQLPPCDVATLHWVAGFIDYEGFFAHVPPALPLVWRLADMNALTGGCHYDNHCGKFTAQCGACPQLNSSDPRDLSHNIWSRKNSSLARRRPDRLHLVATSRWIAAEAKRSSLLGGFPVTIIPNALDTADFAPRDKAFVRDLMGIPQDARVVLFVADDANNIRKGFKQVAECLEGMKETPNLFLLSLGVGRPEVGGVRHLHLGKVNNDRFLSAVYSAADVYVIASLQESFGQTVIEAMACGTPVVGFASGGIPDMVRPGVTGDLAPTGDVPALRATLHKLLNDADGRRGMAENCRRVALDEYSLKTQAEAYLKLYTSLVKPATALLATS